MYDIEFKFDNDKYTVKDFISFTGGNGHVIIHIAEGYIICNKCKYIKEATTANFPKDNTKSNGFRKTCKECGEKKKLERDFKNSDVSGFIKKLEFFQMNPQVRKFNFDIDKMLDYLKKGTLSAKSYFHFKDTVEEAYALERLKHAMRQKPEVMRTIRKMAEFEE